MSTRNLPIDTLRGIACVLLVAVHVVGIDAEAGLRVAEGGMRYVNDALAYIRMPLFTFLSGIVYAYRPFSGEARQFVAGKCRRLLLPMLVVGTLFAIAQAYTPGANDAVESWRLLHILPVAHFWFIEAIFIIFMIMIPLEILRGFRSIRTFSVVLLAASALFLSEFHMRLFAISGAIYLLPFFLLGMALQRYRLIQHLNRTAGIALLGFAAFAIVLSMEAVITSHGKRTTITLVVGGLACIGLLAMRFRSPALARIGVYSYTIYLYHVFFTAGSRVLLSRLGLESLHALFLAGLVAGIIGPILLDRVFSRSNVTRALLLGKSPHTETAAINVRNT